MNTGHFPTYIEYIYIKHILGHISAFTQEKKITMLVFYLSVSILCCITLLHHSNLVFVSCVVALQQKRILHGFLQTLDALVM